MAEENKNKPEVPNPIKFATGKIEPTADMVSRLEKIKPTGFKSQGSVTRNASLQEYNDALATQFQKTGNAMTFDSSMGPVARTPLLYWDPLMDPVLFLWPKDRLDEIYKRYRHYMETHPVISRIIRTHSEFPVTDFFLETEDPEISEYYKDFKDRKKLVTDIHWMLSDYFGIGEGSLYGQWDHFNYEWKSFAQIPGENLDVRGSYISGESLCYLKPDTQLKSLLDSKQIPDQELVKLWDPEFIEAVKSNESYLLREERLIRIVRKIAKYQLRGASLIRCVLKELMYEDKLRLLQLTFVDRHMFPLKLFKLGIKDLPGGAWIPPAEDFVEFQRLLATASNDPDYNIIYHFGVEVEVIGTKDKIANLIPEFEFCEKRIVKGMLGSEAMLSGEVPGYASSMANLRMIMHTYHLVRTMVEQEVIYKIFFKLAQARNFVKRSKAELKHGIRINDSNLKIVKAEEIKEGNYGQIQDPNTGKPVWVKKVDGFLRIAGWVKEGIIKDKYYLPSVIWRPQNLYNNTSMIEFIMRLRDKEQLPFSLVCDVLGLDEAVVKALTLKERNTMFDSNWRAAVDGIIQKDEQCMKKVLQGEPLEDIIQDYLKRKEVEKEMEEKENKNKKINVPVTPEPTIETSPSSPPPPPPSEPSAPAASEEPEKKPKENNEETLTTGPEELRKPPGAEEKTEIV